MLELTNSFPTILLGLMIVLTLVLLPLLDEDRQPREERQRSEEIRRPVGKPKGER